MNRYESTVYNALTPEEWETLEELDAKEKSGLIPPIPPVLTSVAATDHFSRLRPSLQTLLWRLEWIRDDEVPDDSES